MCSERYQGKPVDLIYFNVKKSSTPLSELHNKSMFKQT